MNFSHFSIILRQRKYSIQAAIALLTAGLLLVGCRGNAAPKTGNNTSAETAKISMPRLELPAHRLRAPEFPKSFAWVNTDRPLLIHEQLKGSVVVLDFWTYCCINCMHVIPDLEYLEGKYTGQPVVIVGVHSAKFTNESDRQNIETACARYRIAHPVIVDEDHKIWSEYGVRAWPTLAVIDPEGRIVGTLSGEGNRETLDAVISTLLAEGRERGTLAAEPPEFQHKGRVPAASGLSFPGKVLAYGKYVFISDSDHDRIVIADSTGNTFAIAGSGEKGHDDGSFTKASFRNPQGLAFDNTADILYVADTDNHLIRKLNLTSKTVETVCGTGEQVYDRNGGANGTQQGLNSPWDLALVDGKLYIAMAGSHQIWIMNLQTGKAEAWTGSGTEDILDGTGTRAALAQPSGLTRSGDWLYFADSEVSAIRRANLKTHEVQTLIGTGLFDFGDRDGTLNHALLQHPLGVAAWRDDILVADTYNSKIKRIRLDKGEIAVVCGGSIEPKLYEPGGLSVCGDTLYIADTNHDRIVQFNLTNGEWREFTLEGLHAMQVRLPDTTGIALQEARIRPNSDLRIRLNAEFPSGIHLNADAPIFYTLQPESGIASAVEGRAAALPAEFAVPTATLDSDRIFQISLSFAYCTDGNRSLCVPVTLRWRLKPAPDPTADSTINLASRVVSL
jgi:thiol-disulfide isomerase/thioredoxin